VTHVVLPISLSSFVSPSSSIELREFINEAKTSDNPGTANQVPTRQKMLDKLEAEAVPEPIEVKEFRFQFPEPGKLDHALLEINDMSFSYAPNKEHPEASKMLLHNVNLHMDMESRIGVLGVNGAGQRRRHTTHAHARARTFFASPCD
jgi:ATPase subunit of ABC transporter with duplicated ATPase domains